MNFFQWSLREKSPLYFKRSLFKWERTTDDSVDMAYNRTSFTTLNDIKFFMEKESKGSTEMVPLYVLNKALAFGPKVIKPGSLDFQALEKMDINLQLEDYSQPFDCLIVELPESYSAACEAPDPVYGVPHRPEWVVIAHERVAKVLGITVYLSSDQLYSMVITDTKETIKEMLAQNCQHPFKHSLPADPREQEIFEATINACLNCCLFLDTFGSKCLGAHSPNHYRRLQHYFDCAKKSKDSDRIEKARRDLNSHPVYYGFNQEVRLYNRETVYRVRTGDSGITVQPHWRRGHWKMQPYGPMLSLRKRIRIASVLVNEHLMAADQSETSVTYKV